MCGILAYFNSTGISQERLDQSLRSLKSIRHRGPDGEGVTLINTKTGEFYNLITDETPRANFQNSITREQAAGKQFDLLLGHRRLSIIDLSTNGHQPMLYHNGNWIIFNGEIYNYIEIRNELKDLGYTFRTDSDTEVIHAAYDKWKEKCLDRFNGMFSIVLYDAKQRKLFTANDRFGVKPLYYYINGNEFLFVSEIKQIHSFEVAPSINSTSVNTFLDFGYLDHDDSTFYNEVSRHKSSHYSEIDLNLNTQFEQKRYYTIAYNKAAGLSDSEIKEKFKELLSSAVALRMRSDVPVGFASSGGLDSSSILYTAYSLLNKTGLASNINTFSAVFPGQYGDESYFINFIERDLGIKSHYVNPMNEFTMSDFEKHIYHMDSPIQSTSFYAGWCVSKLVNSKKIKVLLVGQGADEILAGYHHHFYRYGRQLILSGRILKYLSLVKAYAQLKGLDSRNLHKTVINDVKLSLKFKTGLANLGNSLSNKWNRADKLIEALRLDLTETTIPFYLKADDRNGMGFSIESRHPFLDYRLVDFCYSIPDKYKINNGWQKYILREVMMEMPEEIRLRKDKKGFTTPQEKWVGDNLEDFQSFLGHIPKDITLNQKNSFRNYSLGAWFKSRQ